FCRCPRKTDVRSARDVELNTLCSVVTSSHTAEDSSVGCFGLQHFPEKGVAKPNTGNTHDGNLFVARQAFSNCTLIFTCSAQNWWNVCVSCGFPFLGLVLPGASGESKVLLLRMRTYGTITRTSFEELEAAIRGAMSVPPLALKRM
ncbi:unnamed protein product, partial [Ectocarpus sp. 12 AP-2014]